MNIKRMFVFLLALTLVFVGCSKKQEETNATMQDSKQEQTTALNSETVNIGSSKTLVVYFSRVGNTDFAQDVDVVASASLIKDGDVLKGNTQLMAEWIAEEEG